MAVKFVVHSRAFMHRVPHSRGALSTGSGTVSAMRVKDTLGRFGEELAAQHLMASGLSILDRNWRCSDGELDIVAQDESVLVFVEVKTRSSLIYGDPAEAVGAAKAARLRTLALRWLAEHDERYWPQLRFDVVSIVRRAPGGPSVRHLRAVL